MAISQRHDVIRQVLRAARFGTFLLGSTIIASAASGQSSGTSRDLPPLSNPMACPIDAPVRVASSDTLKRFSSLDACAESSIIVAPATQLPRAVTRVIAGPASSEAEAETEADGLFFADQDKPDTKRKAKRRKAEPPAAIMEVATLGRSGTRVVRIAPAVQFPELELASVVVEAAPSAVVDGAIAAAVVPAVVVREGPLSDATILALRPASYTTPHDGLISAAASRHGVDPMMLHAVITQESRYRSSAVSPVGARGLMQVMPGTGAMLGVRNAANLMDPATNIDAGARLLKRLWTRFQGRFDLVLAAYNAGEGAVTRYGYKVPPYRETQNYVLGVKAIYRKLVAERGITYAGR